MMIDLCILNYTRIYWLSASPPLKTVDKYQINLRRFKSFSFQRAWFSIILFKVFLVNVSLDAISQKSRDNVSHS